MRARPPPTAYLVVRRDYPTGYRIPYAICLNRNRAMLRVCEKAGEFGTTNPHLAFQCEQNRCIFTDTDGRKTVFCVETLPLDKENSEKS